ncbi:uncharacterized protein DC041_0008694 [Schistosoma bovis]|uniref:Glutathione S-transferase n=1 Tax=Schistosoma bovis TaxID=6184 RepID=A0A430Q1R8_SCHBO|nr:uncharacterized protein DC041_0008694 [Schistosoma bovis]
MLFSKIIVPTLLNQFPDSRLIRYVFLAYTKIGPELSLADLILFPHLHRFEVVMGRITGKKPEEINELNINDELHTMRKQSFVSDVTIPYRIHVQYAASVLSGHANPDIE